MSALVGRDGQGESNKMTRRRFRVRRVGKWAGLKVCFSIVVLFVVSRWLEIRYVNHGRGIDIYLTPGAVVFSWTPSFGAGSYWRFDDCDPEIAAEWWPTAHWERIAGHVMVPLWIVLVPVAVLTAMLWWGDGRRRGIGSVSGANST